MARGKDLTQRTRRSKSDAQKLATHQRKNRAASAGSRRISDLFQSNQQNNTSTADTADNDADENANDTDNPPVREEDVAIDDSAAAQEEQDDDAIVFSESLSYDPDSGGNDIVANLDIDEDNDGLDAGIEAEPDDTPVAQKGRKVKNGIQQQYQRALHDQLKSEMTPGEVPVLQQWLTEQLKKNKWCVSKIEAPSTAKRLGLTTYHHVYYREVKVWLPEKMFKGNHMPPCPTCQSNKDVIGWGWNQYHIGRLIIGLTENYSIITHRYKCCGCENEKKRQDNELKQLLGVNKLAKKDRVKLKYTFMGWDRDSLPIMANGRGDEFPAFLTWRAGIDKTLIDMMRIDLDHGVRSNAFSRKILELHSKDYTRAWLAYERDIADDRQAAERMGVHFVSKQMFSEFDDEDKWNGKVPTGAYFSSALRQYSESIKDHFAKEVKKRGAITLSADASYKEAKHLCQYRGKSIFNGLITMTNDVGEVRVQHHVVSDSHDQIKPPMEAFKNTSTEYGIPHPKIVSTDDPMRDYKFFLGLLESLRDSKVKFNAGLDLQQVADLPTYPYDPNTPFLEILSKHTRVDLAIAAMLRVMNKEKGLGLDCEWRVTFNGRGKKIKQWKIGLVQLAYCNKGQNDRIQYLFIRTNSTTNLPRSLIQLLNDNSFNFVGVNVGGDLARLGRDFQVEDIVAKRKKSTIINLGQFARRRDVVQNGSVGLKQLTKIVLSLLMNKNDEDKFSNWNATKLKPEQIKYAVLDVDSSLRIYMELKKKPDLTSRLILSEASTGKKVDLVPRNGSVACMATRAATGSIIDGSICHSPDGIEQKKVRAGQGTVAIQIEHVYSPGMIVPNYRRKGSRAPATLSDFEFGQLVVPIQMLKKHVDCDDIRSTPTSASPSGPVGITLPSENVPIASANSSEQSSAAPTNSVDGRAVEDSSAEENNVEPEENENNDIYPTAEEIDESGIDLTSRDIEHIRASILEGQTTANGRVPLQCAHLQDPPALGEIVDVFSPVLGDVFHAMNRPYVPIKHEVKKMFYWSLHNAFYVWNEEKMAEFVGKLKSKGMSDEEIESMKYYNAKMFTRCVDREVPPPSILYWRVRAVFALCGPMVDSKTKKPLFNALAWKKANGVLKEIILGFYSDPPGVSMYTKVLNEDGSAKTNIYGMELIDCIRGTNRTEAYHKNLVVTFGSWHAGVRMSDCLLRERRHRHNHRCSERRRFGFPKLGHYDTWLIDQLQNLVLDNHNIVLYPNWSNASDYKQTSESFDTVALHNIDLHNALKDQWENNIVKENVKLTGDQKYLCSAMGTALPFLPFATEEENKLFADCVLRNDFPSMDDDESAAIAWCQYVDGVNIFPKLPVHIRIHRESFERNQRVRDCVRRARKGRDILHELNKALRPSASAATEAVVNPPSMPMTQPEAMHNSPYVVIGGTAVGKLPQPTASHAPRKRRGERGKDKVGDQKKRRAPKACGLCKKLSPQSKYFCPGSGARKYCEYWELDGAPKCR